MYKVTFCTKELKELKMRKRKINFKKLFVWYFHIITMMVGSFELDYSFAITIWAYCLFFLVFSFKMISEEQEYKQELKKRGIA